jgi:hypothetical protein
MIINCGRGPGKFMYRWQCRTEKHKAEWILHLNCPTYWPLWLNYLWQQAFRCGFSAPIKSTIYRCYPEMLKTRWFSWIYEFLINTESSRSAVVFPACERRAGIDDVFLLGRAIYVSGNKTNNDPLSGRMSASEEGIQVTVDKARRVINYLHSSHPAGPHPPKGEASQTIIGYSFDRNLGEMGERELLCVALSLFDWSLPSGEMTEAKMK